MLLLSVNAACGGYRRVPSFVPGPPPATAPLAGTPLTTVWETRPLRGPSAPIAHDSVAAYMGGIDRRVIAVDLVSGRTRWSHRVTGPLLSGVLLAGETIFAATDRPGGKVHAFYRRSGNELWSTRTGYVEAPLALAAGRLIVLTREQRILGIDTMSGRIAWRKRLPSHRVGPLALGDSVVLVTSYDSLYRVHVGDGRVELRRRSPGTLVSQWVPLGGWLIGATADSQVVAIRPDSLDLAWSATLDAPLLSSPAIRDDTIYAVTRIGSVYRIVPGDTPETTQLSSEPWPATGAPAIFGSWLLVGGSEGALRAFELADGAEAWHTAMGRPLELAPLILGDSGFLALGGRGDLYRIGL